ncbi:hypothetical protein EJ05DRAFT_105669 [Pseudovirgaria hyperparasitica]|uniref:Multiple myeloma tumor-associated protein 2-like N-terminal domain-containing protein n=1 Tax=Pseudovirgaria hyperparasitica TaxID=470096 RepID=A0A6A6W3G8_9PEZI|nr:uncharacterized protein EJ05DRAFT_105669 [Pseudovirgaria hyperparasitica]KAF2755581.1 hypothetical protein EJ05DRAFT_105669 [Pseudovirgaria hyperparasitica]
MDLLQSVRKEGSRGGRGDFKWDDVKGDQHRENYLGHSLMAPVGRWQRNKDLNWYAKGDANPDDPDPERTAALARAEELRKVKEAEEDAMAAALGLPPPVRDRSGANAVPVAAREGISDKEMRKAVAEGRDDDHDGLGRGTGFTKLGGPNMPADEARDVLEGDVVEGGLRGEKRSRQRSRSRDRNRQRHDDRHRRRRDHDDRDRRRRRDSSRSRSRERHRRHRSRSRDNGRDSKRRRSRSREYHHQRARPRSDHVRIRSRSRDRNTRRRDRSHSPDRGSTRGRKHD